MNTRPIVYLKEAIAEIDELYTDYELIRSGLGERFYSALAKQTSRIASNPEMYGIIEDGMRACPLLKFPQVIYYKIESNLILIVAVQHGRVDWNFWRKRLP